jgi:hypothetical protein
LQAIPPQCLYRQAGTLRCRRCGQPAVRFLMGLQRCERRAGVWRQIECRKLRLSRVQPRAILPFVTAAPSWEWDPPLGEVWNDDDNLFCGNTQNYAQSPPSTC